MQLRLYHPTRISERELVLPIQVSPQEAVKRSSAFLTFGFGDSAVQVELQDTQFVGEAFSIVYFPFWLLEVGAGDQTGLLIIDAVANQVKRTLWQQDLSSFLNGQGVERYDTGSETLDLIPFRCPVCGWDLPFSPQSKVHICPTCTRAWAEYKGAYTQVEYQLTAVESGCEHILHYMPFWVLQTRIHTAQGLLSTRADLRKLAPGLTAGRQDPHAADPIRFPIPAFRIKSMRSLCRFATLFSRRPPDSGPRVKERLEKEKFAAVYLLAGEAEEMARVVLFSLVPKYHRTARRLLKEATFESRPPVLTYYPFFRKGLYLREVNSNHGIQHGAVAVTVTE
jgi:hypothetical protein